TKAEFEAVYCDGDSLEDLYPEFADELAGIAHVYGTFWECKQPYDDPGAYAFDDCEGDITSQISVAGVENILTGETGIAYLVLYAVLNPPRDIPAQYRIRVVVIQDSIRPIASLQGEGYAYGNMQDSNFTPPPYWWWPVCQAAYQAKYETSQWFGDSVDAVWDLPTASAWISSSKGVKEEWIEEPMKWYCDKASYEDPGAVVMDSCEGFLEPNETVIVITRSNIDVTGLTKDQEVFVYVARLGDLNGLIDDDPRCSGDPLVIEEPYSLAEIEQLLLDNFDVADADADGLLTYEEATTIYAELTLAEFYAMSDYYYNDFLSRSDLFPECEDPFPRFYQSSHWHGYRIYYFMRDSSGNLVFRRTRLVEPRYGVAIIGVEGTTTINCGDDFSPTEGITVLDTCEGDITNRLIITGYVDTAVPGTYELLYSAENNYGTPGQSTRRIDVVDNIPPKIILLNDSGTPEDNPEISIPWCVWRMQAAEALYGKEWWNDQYWLQPYNGWVVEDLCDDGVRLTGEVLLGGKTDIREALQFLQDPRGQGVDPAPYLKNYPVYHNVTDTNGNHALPVIRNVTIAATTPDIILIGDIMKIWECGVPYEDEGVGTINDLMEGGSVDACYTGDPNSGYFETSFKVVPPETAPDSVPYAPYFLGATVITIDDSVLGDHAIMFRTTNPLNYAQVVTRTVRVADGHGPEISADFVNYILPHDDGDIYEFDCLNVLEADISEFLTYTATDSCDSDITDKVEYEIIREDQADGTGIYTVKLSVTDTGGNLTEKETEQFISISTSAPTLDLGTWTGDVDGPFQLHDCAVDFVEPADFTGVDGCGADLGAPQSELLDGDPGIWVWAWALDETGEPLWQETDTDPEPVVYAYVDGFTKLKGDYLIIYTAFDLWDDTYPELGEDDDLPPVFDEEGNLFRDGDGNLTIDFARLVRVVDRTAPVITLAGEEAPTINCGIPFSDPGATAADLCDGDLSADIVVGGDLLDVTIIGTYVLTYNVSDSTGNAAALKTRIVTVIDSIVPTITLLGSDEITLECGIDSYNDPGVLASDSCVGNLTDGVEITGDAVDTGVAGDYTITYSVRDADDNVAAVNRIVHVVDTTAPVITLLEAEVINVECGINFEDPGYLAEDACTGDLSAEVIVEGDVVDTGVFGVYVITYTVSDSTGNVTIVTRTVNVVDGTPPVITLPGDNPVTTPWGEPYTEPTGYTALDACDGDLTATVIVSGEELIDTNTIGEYEVWYAAEDSSGNVAEEVRTVTVVDPSAPVITLVGDASLTVECGSEFADPGATATDAIDGDLTDSVTIVVNPDMMYIPGEYSVTYRVINSRGSVTETDRTVTVGDTAAPTITLRGPATVIIDCNAPLFILDDYAVATDLCDSTPTVKRIGDVSTDTGGTYTV
ncbi:MAG: DUF5011 domain-containing protein, partial [Candidatus Hydrogenedentes bacterium]|nr:DUF5011 domain-containing protein [Candidatus Hydrogenedentota bacterium]